jgi:hypothetical protein
MDCKGKRIGLLPSFFETWEAMDSTVYPVKKKKCLNTTNYLL